MAIAEKELYLKIGRPQNACVQCGATISHAGKHPSALLDPDGPNTAPRQDVTLRRDYCQQCWQQLGHEPYLGYWLARREPPKVRAIKTRKERNAALLSYFELLRQQQDTTSEERAQSLFFLAHLLMKYGVLKWVRSDAPAQQGAPEIIVFRNPAADEMVEIESVELDDQRIAEIKREVDEFLSRAVSQESESVESAGAVAEAV